MASEVDSELTFGLTDPSSDSLLGDKTEVGEKTTPIPSSSQNDPQSESVKEKDNVDKPEKTGEGSIDDTDSSGHPRESQPQISVSENEKKTTQIPSSSQNDPQSESVKEKDNVDKPEKTGEGSIDDTDSSGHPRKSQPQISVSENEKKTTQIPSSSQNDPQSESVKEKDYVDKPEKTEEDVGSSGDSASKEEDESQFKIQKLKETGKARDINERGDGFKHTGLPQDNQPQISVGWNDRLHVAFAVAVAVAVVALLVSYYFSDSTPPVPEQFNVVDVFNQEMEKLQTNFPNQRPELWRRSLIHIRRHLKTEHPTEPVSLILTSGHGAERTLDCLARCLAQAFSNARNSSFLNIDGKSKASQDSDQVKLDIDSELRNAFDGKKFAAVIHRFEELPPGATLIFYRYCDHENAAYKNVFLAFTVMLDGEVEVPSNVNLGRVEEMVQEHVKQKFVSSDKLATFNQMDVDKLSGLWSRISHLILPVAAEQKIEQQGCGDCEK